MPRKRGKDEFIKQMYDVLFSCIDKSFSSSIKDQFIEIEGKTICVLKIQNSIKPVYFNNKGRSEFYVRIGSKSEPYDNKQTHDYIDMKKRGNK